MPKTIIYYFSATGNSLAVARSLAAKLEDVQLIHMAKQDETPMSNDVQKIGIIFPVYIFGLPLIVTRCIEKLKVSNNVYTFAIATHGGIPSATLKQAEETFAKYGKILSSGFKILMVDNAVMNADIISVEKRNIRYNKAEKCISELANKITNNERTIDHGWPIIDMLFSGLYWKLIPDLNGFDRNFSLDTNCNGCGICQKVCPMGNITIMDQRPVWHHHCEQCLACFHWCPPKAIQYGPKTAKRLRYHHPNITLNDMILRNG